MFSNFGAEQKENCSQLIMPRRQAKNWVFTLNNYTNDEVDALEALGTELPSPLCYLVFGKEQGENGTPHLQGYICYKSKKEFNVVKSVVSPRAHIEPAKGSPRQASDYCKKDNEYKEYGTLPKGKGYRSDLHDIARKIRQGATIRRISQEHPESYIRYNSGIKKLKHLVSEEQPRHVPQIWVFWGPTGSGKSRRVWEFTSQSQCWVSPGSKWFDGYDDHPAVLFDDFDGSWFKLTYLLKLLDRHPFSVPVKGAYVTWNPKTIYLTSNHEPKEWYADANPEHQAALLRRLTEFGTIVHIE